MPNSNPRDRTIRVIVQANKLFNSDLYESDVDNFTSLVEDGGLGNGFGDTNRDFETIVFMNKNICWSIEINDPSGEDKNYSVNLSSVFHNSEQGNPNFFSKEKLDVHPGTGLVCGVISKNPDLTNKDDNYTIEFDITYSTQNPPLSTIKSVLLDPKLKISVRQ